jgi:formylglycine-generating enzyme required for sulfatase activity
MNPVALATLLIGLVAAPAVADDATTLRTQTIPLKLARPLWVDGKETTVRPAIELVRIPPGKVTLKTDAGKDVTHEVKAVWVARYETRWDEYNVFWQGIDLTQKDHVAMISDETARRVRPPYHAPWGGYGEIGHPACSVRLRAAKAYCAWLCKHTGKTFRLPTEAEWEYACRAGGPPLRPDAKALDKLAWSRANAGGEPRPVGKKEPNAWGLHDMLGNVAEYVVRDPTDDKGLVAGGAWTSKAEDVHVAAREAETAAWTQNDPEDPPNPDWLEWTRHDIGFRVVMED